MEAEMIASSNSIRLNGTTERVYAGEDVGEFVRYQGPTPNDWWREGKEGVRRPASSDRDWKKGPCVCVYPE